MPEKRKSTHSDRQHKKRKRDDHGFHENDSICMKCQCGGVLILCDHCPSSFHLACIHLEEVPEGKWFCPACVCGLCKEIDSTADLVLYTDVCLQCNRRYHVDCLTKKGYRFPRNIPSLIFCTQNCYKLCVYLHHQLGVSYSTSRDGLSWTMIRSETNDCSFDDVTRRDTSNLLSAASDLMQKCFYPLTEPCTKRDLLVDVVYNAMSDIKRLDFRGFYVIVLRDGEELVSAATVRIHGHKVAEIPLIATDFKYRGKGMCRLLYQELEKMLIFIGVKRLLLPSVSELLRTWKDSFGFSEIPYGERLEFLGYPFLTFQGTILLQKVLTEKRGWEGDLKEMDQSSSTTSTDGNGVAADEDNAIWLENAMKRQKSE